MKQKIVFNPLTGKFDYVALQAHTELTDMPDAGGTNSDHDARYYTETEIDASLALYLPLTGGTIDGNLTTLGTITSRAITIFHTIPILVFKDSTYVGDDSLGYIEWRDANNTRLGYFGNSSSGTNDLYWKNEYSGGHINITTTGAGEFKVFANIDAQDNNITTTGRIASGTSTFSTAGPTDNIDVSGVNTLFVDSSSNNVTIGGFASGVDGQVLNVVRISAANDVTIEHNEGGATQPILLHNGADETLDAHFGGWTFICHGGDDWHDASHAKHV